MDVFAWTYKDLKNIPLELAQHKIELDTPSTHHVKYVLNPNYVATIKHDIDKLCIKFHTTFGRGYMAITNCGITKEKWEAQNLCGF